MSYLSENITALMEQKGLNATTLAQATGVPQPTIHRILKGVSKDPRTDTVRPLADFFGIPAETLRSTFLGAAGEGARTAGSSHPSQSGGLKDEATRGLIYDVSKSLRASRNRRAQFDQELRSLAEREGLRGDVDFRDRVTEYRFDYVSPTLVAEFALLPIRSFPFPHGSRARQEEAALEDSLRRTLVNTSSLHRTLWRLSCVRLMHQQQHMGAPDRQYVLFVDTISLEDDIDIRPVAAKIGRVIAEAQLHGIQVVWCGPQQAAKIILAAEKGERVNSMMATDDYGGPDEDDLDNFE